ncbi:hypothetical protein D3C76_872660 [compost metagenome]|uniref:Uncharacterized protein n=1 Tax=Pseudomonas jinjuensis TaxID=198616 RepID=A0A1H0CZP3_9PSED|nr:hypothetical protein [Pseudomonas jinjuensis]SDN63387.1 hypothetical protein SAMN05216193_10482 [Pseudomonas jinjuensis]
MSIRGMGNEQRNPPVVDPAINDPGNEDPGSQIDREDPSIEPEDLPVTEENPGEPD